MRGLPPVAASGGHSSSRCAGLSCCGAQAPDAQAQQLWLTGPVAPRHVGSSQTRARTRVPCIGRQTLNHCATREVQAQISDSCGEKGSRLVAGGGRGTRQVRGPRSGAQREKDSRRVGRGRQSGSCPRQGQGTCLGSSRITPTL